MRLTVDASVLIAELLRVAGRERLAHPALDVFVPEQTHNELRHELPRRISAFCGRHGLDRDDAAQLSSLCLAAVDANVAIVDAAVLAPLEDEARARALRDPDDWPLVACALALDADIWTQDNDLLGTGIATWTTQSLTLWLRRHPPAER
ncbi:MAG TPA: PIN domain-containing protein [Jatrophihabitans sp.]|nr:PIN domain-containing protein [Jatrophihabitans sp.]